MIRGRFRGSVEALGPVPSAPVAAWLSEIPFEAWPQQSRLADGQIRPAMVNSQDWWGSRAITAPLVAAVLSLVPGARAGQQLISVVMPGHSIPEHVDAQAPDWWARVHVPLATNAESRFVVDGVPRHLEEGVAYLVNTERPHAVTNDGLTPRVHWMVDLFGG